MNVGALSVALPGRGRAIFTDRSHGNMSSVGGVEHEQGARSRERLREQIGVGALARVHQVHGAVVRTVKDGSTGEMGRDDLPRADGQRTSTSGLGLMVLAADCLPVALGHASAVAMVHAGWRGLAGGILEQGVRALRADSGPGTEIVAVIGPGAGACCYEVGPEVHAAFGDHRRAPARIDLRALARERLIAAGVDRVEELGGCTICDERYFSHRREGAASGRMAGVAWLS